MLGYALWYSRYGTVTLPRSSTQALTPQDAPDHVFKEGVRPSGALALATTGERPSGLLVNGRPVRVAVEVTPLQGLGTLADWYDLVRVLQTQLNSLGAAPLLDEDGRIGRHTKAAMDAYFAGAPYAAESARWGVKDRGRWWRGALEIDQTVQATSGRPGLPRVIHPPAYVLEEAYRASREAPPIVA